MKKTFNSDKIKVELKVPGFNTPNNIRLLKGNLTLNEFEKKQLLENTYLIEECL